MEVLDASIKILIAVIALEMRSARGRGVARNILPRSRGEPLHSSATDSNSAKT
jgi:hypothetical protein